MTIPDDIMKTAREAVSKKEGWLDSALGVEAIARAIMAERDRCAKVAERMLVFADTTSRSDRAIASAIRKGEGE